MEDYLYTQVGARDANDTEVINMHKRKASGSTFQPEQS